MSLLAIDRLSVRYGGTPALDNVSLSVEPGEIVAVVGESGSGKSTLAAACLALLPPSAWAKGEVRIEDALLAAMDPGALRRVRGGGVGMIFQDPAAALNPALTIGRQIGEVLEAHATVPRAEIAQEVAALLARVGLEVSPSRYPHTLSGGQRQRAAIAMAIAARPALLIADEPTAALDALARAAVMKLLVGLVRERGMGLLLVSHDLALVGSAADRLAVLDRGRLVEHGPARSRLERPASTALRAMVEAMRAPGQPRPLPTEDTVLTVAGVSRLYPATARLFERRRVTALQDVSFELRQGETLAVIGESGSGKSTLARLVLGLDRPDRGSIAFGERSWDDRSAAKALRREVQAVFQDPAQSLDPRWTVGRIVAEPLHLLGGVVSPERIAEALAQVGLPADAAERLPAQFSGGQRQRIALARALILRPKLVVLDEALSALDARVRMEMVELLLRLQRELGLTYLFIAHDLALVRGLADRVLVLRGGRGVEQGPAAEVLERPREPYTAALVEAARVA